MSRNTAGDFPICQCTCEHQNSSGNVGKEKQVFYLSCKADKKNGHYKLGGYWKEKNNLWSKCVTKHGMKSWTQLKVSPARKKPLFITHRHASGNLLPFQLHSAPTSITLLPSYWDTPLQSMESSSGTPAPEVLTHAKLSLSGLLKHPCTL